MHYQKSIGRIKLGSATILTMFRSSRDGLFCRTPKIFDCQDPPMHAFPAFFPLEGAVIVVAGAGEGADAKARLFDGSPARLQRLTGESAFDAAAYQGAALAFIAHPDEAFCVAAAAAARKFGVPVNVVDRPQMCDFTTPAMIDRGQVVAAIGTGGSAPLLASLLRADIEARIPAGIGQIAGLLKAMQGEIRAAFPDLVRRRAFMRLALSGPAAQAAMDGDLDGARRYLLDLLGRPMALTGRAYRLDDQPAAELLSLKAARLLSEADVLVLGEHASPQVVVLARRDAERLKVANTDAEALAALLAQGLCLVLIAAPDLAKALMGLGHDLETLPTASA
jgi:precorrin-2 dehydrogenase/sirohydrochlorin ferrochelatase